MIVGAAALIYSVVDHVRTRHIQRHEAAFQATLASYHESLTPGMSREQVENFLRARGVSFQRFCCIDEESTDADITKIGEEIAPWYFSNVYVEFQFYSGTNRFAKVDGSDRLKTVVPMRKLEDCL